MEIKTKTKPVPARHGCAQRLALNNYEMTLFFRSAFFHYASDERPKVRAANPNFAVGDIAKELGRRWADADPTVKSKYEARAEKDRERYIKQKAEFQQVLEEEKNGIVHTKDSPIFKQKKYDSDEAEEEAEPAEEDEAESEWILLKYPVFKTTFKINTSC